MAVKSTHADQERLITMADTEREKRKKVFEDFMKPYKKEDKKDKKEREKSLRAADRKAAELDRYLADRDKEGDFNKGGVVKRKKKPKVTKKTYSRGSRKAKYNG